jgi:hypothetical protein
MNLKKSKGVKAYFTSLLSKINSLVFTLYNNILKFLGACGMDQDLKDKYLHS